MWKRSDLKKKAHALLKQNYWKAISVCFIIAVLTTSYRVSSAFLSLRSVSAERVPDAAFQITIDMFSSHITLFYRILHSVSAFLNEGIIAGLIPAVAGLLLAFLYQIFIHNLLLIGEKRFFMESHSYKKTMISKIFFLFKLRCLLRPAWIMFCRFLPTVIKLSA